MLSHRDGRANHGPHCIAARVRFLVNVKGDGWAAAAEAETFGEAIILQFGWMLITLRIGTR
jgi:hypothetical protein